MWFNYDAFHFIKCIRDPKWKKHTYRVPQCINNLLLTNYIAQMKAYQTPPIKAVQSGSTLCVQRNVFSYSNNYFQFIFVYRISEINYAQTFIPLRKDKFQVLGYKLTWPQTRPFSNHFPGPSVSSQALYHCAH